MSGLGYEHYWVAGITTIIDWIAVMLFNELLTTNIYTGPVDIGVLSKVLSSVQEAE